MNSRQQNEKAVVIYDTFCGWCICGCCYGAASAADVIADADRIATFSGTWPTGQTFYQHRERKAK